MVLQMQQQQQQKPLYIRMPEYSLIPSSVTLGMSFNLTEFPFLSLQDDVGFTHLSHKGTVEKHETF